MNMKVTSTIVRTWSRIGSGGVFGQTLLDLAADNEKAVALTADMTTASGLERFKAAYPERYVNVGIAEQDLVGVAAGFAKEGFVPFTVTQAAFMTLRCADQVKVNMGYMNLPVKLVGILSGFGVGIFGPTHMAIEDVALMRAIPNITILAPADGLETAKAILAAAKIDSPVYLRLSGGVPNPIVYSEDYDFEIGKAITLREGTDVAVIAAGSMVSAALSAAKLLDGQGLSCSVMNMHTIKPLDVFAIKAACSAKLIVTVEEHNVIGGLGSAVAEILAPMKERPPQLILGVKDFYPHAGGYNWLLEQCGLTPPQIASAIASKYESHRRWA
jgi:transketolase